MKSVLALITYLDSGPVDPNYGVPGPPYPVVPRPPGVPTHPIYYPPYVDNSLPVPPGIWPSPGHPAHPIVLPPPGYPSHPIYWPPYPDNSLPPFPAHPIVIPPGQPPNPQPPSQGGMPGQLPASNPDGNWVWGYVPGYGWMWAYVPSKPDSDLKPEHPIVIPPEGEDKPEVNPLR